MKGRKLSDLIWILDVIDEIVLALIYVILYKKLNIFIANIMLLICSILGICSTFPYAIKDKDPFVKNKNRVDFIIFIVMFIIAMLLLLKIMPVIAVILVCPITNFIRLFVYQHYKDYCWFWWIWAGALCLDIAAIILFFIL